MGSVRGGPTHPSVAWVRPWSRVVAVGPSRQPYVLRPTHRDSARSPVLSVRQGEVKLDGRDQAAALSLTVVNTGPSSYLDAIDGLPARLVFVPPRGGLPVPGRDRDPAPAGLAATSTARPRTDALADDARRAPPWCCGAASRTGRWSRSGRWTGRSPRSCGCGAEACSRFAQDLMSGRGPSPLSAAPAWPETRRARHAGSGVPPAAGSGVSTEVPAPGYPRGDQPTSGPSDGLAPSRRLKECTPGHPD